MKQNIFLIVLFTFVIHINSQRKPKVFYQDYVECFHKKKSNEPIEIFDRINGGVVYKLEVLKDEFSYYKFTISKSKKGWLKIKNLMILPAFEKHNLNKNANQFNGKWIKAENLKINLPDTSPESGIMYTFYEKPNLKSKAILKINEFKSLDLLGVKKTWAYVKVIHEGNDYYGWIERKYQCPYPWTNCIVNK